MNVASRMALALLVWLAAVAAGWWWHRPASTAVAAAPAAAASSVAAEELTPPAAPAMAHRLIALDPMGLTRGPAAAGATGVPATTAAATAPSWRLAALVVRGGERYAVLTAADQPSLTLRPGQLLPDGDRIKSIEAEHIQIQSPRGRLRTLYLIEP